jgi:ABC-type nickel/cobalt efflux system permease component RcnA
MYKHERIHRHIKRHERIHKETDRKQGVLLSTVSYVGLLPCASTIRRAATVIIIAAVKGEAQ